MFGHGRGIELEPAVVADMRGEILDRGRGDGGEAEGQAVLHRVLRERDLGAGPEESGHADGRDAEGFRIAPPEEAGREIRDRAAGEHLRREDDLVQRLARAAQRPVVAGAAVEVFPGEVGKATLGAGAQVGEGRVVEIEHHGRATLLINLSLGKVHLA